MDVEINMEAVANRAARLQRVKLFLPHIVDSGRKRDDLNSGLAEDTEGMAKSKLQRG
jgi:hypothetical protein